MSGTGRMLDLSDAEWVAGRLREQIHGESHIVGSIRRKKPQVGDIEIMVHRDAEVALQVSQGPMFPGEFETVKGGKGEWGYWQLRHIECGYVVDLFRFDGDNRGSIMLIRTGPWEFSQRFVVALRGRGLRHEGGYVVHHGGMRLSCPTELDAFAMAGMAYIEPEDRA